MMENKPHILLLIDDEHRADVMSIEANVKIRTPTLNRLINQGIYFRNAYTLSLICVPARQSFLSGLYPRHSGCTGCDCPLPSGVLTIPGHFSRYGYHTVSAGNMDFVGPDQMHGWHERIGRDVRRPNGYVLATDPVYCAQTVSEAGTGKWSSAKEIANARVGKGAWMQHDEYSVDGALMFLDEYFVDEVHDRSGDRPLLIGC